MNEKPPTLNASVILQTIGFSFIILIDASFFLVSQSSGSNNTLFLFCIALTLIMPLLFLASLLLSFTRSMQQTRPPYALLVLHSIMILPSIFTIGGAAIILGGTTGLSMDSNGKDGYLLFNAVCGVGVGVVIMMIITHLRHWTAAKRAV